MGVDTSLCILTCVQVYVCLCAYVSSYVGVEFRNGVVYVRQRARARPIVSPMWVTHIDEVEPETLHSKPDFRWRTRVCKGGRERERETGGTRWDKGEG